MVVVPQGSFKMGAALDERKSEGAPDGVLSELPVHPVIFAKPFAMSVHEITRGQFAAFVKATGYQAPKKCSYLQPKNVPETHIQPDWRNPRFHQSDRHPVVCVSWEDAKAYAAWLSKLTGQTYRLPSEAEWEYAARAGMTGSRYWTGKPGAEACRYANVADHAIAKVFEWSPTHRMLFQCDDGYAFTAPVGAFAANDFGLYDMIGNVWEWVEDCWHDSYAGAPSDGTAWLTGDCAHRIDRSGSWNDAVWIARAANRGMEDSGAATTNLGIRLVRDLK
jgi:formylglycine-generating enzyme required for sulfatase activity